MLAPQSLAVMPAHEGGEVSSGAVEVHAEAPCVFAGIGNGRGGHGQCRLLLR